MDAPGDGETLDGTLDRVVWSGGDAGFVVARLQVPGATEPVTIVGEMIGVGEGSPLRLHGRWVNDRKWGRQFKIESYQLRAPETLIGIERFLGSGLIPGVGPELAKRLVRAFAMDTLEVIDRAPQRLTEVDGIGAGRAGKIASAWREHRHVQDVMVFLRGHGVSAAFAARIVKRYGKEAINRVRENPYRLALDIWGIGFRTADDIARRLGMARDAPQRLEAGLVHVLGERLGDGHVHSPEDEWQRVTAELLGVDVGTLPAGIGGKWQPAQRAVSTSRPWSSSAPSASAHRAWARVRSAGVTGGATRRPQAPSVSVSTSAARQLTARAR